jgi:hypothetical protein
LLAALHYQSRLFVSTFFFVLNTFFLHDCIGLQESLDLCEFLLKLLDVVRYHAQLRHVREVESVVRAPRLVRLTPEHHHEYLLEKIY